MTEPKKGGSTRRCLKMITVMVSRVLDGLSPSELAELTGESAVNVCRALAILEQEGWAKKLENGRWALTLLPLQLLQAFHNHFGSVQQRLGEINHNIISGARRFE